MEGRGGFRPHAFTRPAQAGHRPARRLEIGLPGRLAPAIGLRRRGRPLGRRGPAAGRRPFEVEFIRHPTAPGHRPARRLEIGLPGRLAPAIGLRRRGGRSAGGGRPLAEGLLRSNSFDAPPNHRPYRRYRMRTAVSPQRITVSNNGRSFNTSSSGGAVSPFTWIR